VEAPAAPEKDPKEEPAWMQEYHIPSPLRHPDDGAWAGLTAAITDSYNMVPPSSPESAYRWTVDECDIITIFDDGGKAESSGFTGFSGDLDGDDGSDGVDGLFYPRQ
jgi:hypothetical protein